MLTLLLCALMVSRIEKLGVRGYFSLYREQHFLHSKLRIVGVQRVHGHWSETDAAHLTTNDDGEN